MKTFIATLIFMGSVTACASESKIKIEESREVAQADQAKIEEVERPESLKYDSPAHKKHKDYLKYIDRHDRK